MLPGLTTGNEVTDSLYDDEAVRRIMERHSEMAKRFREAKFSRKLEQAKNMRSKGYEDVILHKRRLGVLSKPRKEIVVGTGADLRSA